MDDIQKRLKETSDSCLESYEKWTGSKKDSDAREALRESIHEVRKVASRLEIEMAVSERDEAGVKPLPVPPHRSYKNKAAQGQDDGNRQPARNDGPKPPRNRKPRKSQGGS